MLIEHILQRKGADVATVAPDATVTEALSSLHDHNVGALVVVDDDTVSGIISERDVVRALAERGPGVLDRPVSRLMSTDLTTRSPRTTVDELMRLMTDHRIRHIPVIDEGRLVGIVSIGDVVKTRIDELQQETETLQGYLHTGR